jgi:hypothetical protein
MAFTPVLKSLAEVAVQVTPFQALTEIVSPHEEFKPAGYLQIIRIDGQNDEPFVIEGGMIVAISARTETRFVNRLDIANGGVAQTITYTQSDVDYGVEDVAVPGSLRTTTGAVAAARPANIPIGFAPFPYYRGILDDIYINFELQPFVPVWNQGYLEYPIVKSAQDSGADALVRGRLVRPGPNGELLFWDPSADSVDQIVGRCWTIKTIADDVALRGLDKVRTVPGLALSGTGTGGVPAYLYKDFEGGGKATKKFRVVIDAAV